MWCLQSDWSANKVPVLADIKGHRVEAVGQILLLCVFILQQLKTNNVLGPDFKFPNHESDKYHKN